MKNNKIYSYIVILILPFLLNACSLFSSKGVEAQQIPPVGDVDVTLKLPQAAADNAEIFIVLGKEGKVDFVGKNNKPLRKIPIGDERPIVIEKFFPGEVVKTLDQIMIFSGSPSCLQRDGFFICP